MREPGRLTRLLRSLGLVLLGFASLAVSMAFSDNVVGPDLDPGLRSLAILAGILGFVFLLRDAIRSSWPELDDAWRDDDRNSRSL